MCKFCLKVKYIDMDLIRGVNCGAKILLAHFRLICKGNVPFRKDFDWSVREHKRMALLKDQEMAFVASYISKLQATCKPVACYLPQDSWLTWQGLSSSEPA